MRRPKRGLARGPGNALRRSARWTGARRETYFTVLGETGNARAAAEAIGMNASTLRDRRRKDADFARDYQAAIAAAAARLGGEAEIGLDDFETIRPGPDGRLQIVAAGVGRWNGRIERQFLDLLRMNGNMSASARAVGFTPETIWERRRKWPAFAEAIEAVLEEAELELQFRLAKQGNDVVPAAGGTVTSDCPQQPFDPEFALKFLKWREEKRAGRGVRGRGDHWQRPRTLDEVRDSILRKLSAIAAHRRRAEQEEKGGKS